MSSTYDVVRQLRSNGEGDGALVAALTGFGTEEDRQQSLQAGFDLHLVKPASLADLQKLLRHPKLAGVDGASL